MLNFTRRFLNHKNVDLKTESENVEKPRVNCLISSNIKCFNITFNNSDT